MPCNMNERDECFFYSRINISINPGRFILLIIIIYFVDIIASCVVTSCFLIHLHRAKKITEIVAR